MFIHDVPLLWVPLKNCYLPPPPPLALSRTFTERDLALASLSLILVSFSLMQARSRRFSSPKIFTFFSNFSLTRLELACNSSKSRARFSRSRRDEHQLRSASSRASWVLDFVETKTG